MPARLRPGAQPVADDARRHEHLAALRAGGAAGRGGGSRSGPTPRTSTRCRPTRTGPGAADPAHARTSRPLRGRRGAGRADRRAGRGAGPGATARRRGPRRRRRRHASAASRWWSWRRPGTPPTRCASAGRRRGPDGRHGPRPRHHGGRAPGRPARRLPRLAGAAAAAGRVRPRPSTSCPGTVPPWRGRSTRCRRTSPTGRSGSRRSAARSPASVPPRAAPRPRSTPDPARTGGTRASTRSPTSPTGSWPTSTPTSRGPSGRPRACRSWRQLAYLRDA